MVGKLLIQFQNINETIINFLNAKESKHWMEDQKLSIYYRIWIGAREGVMNIHFFQAHRIYFQHSNGYVDEDK